MHALSIRSRVAAKASLRSQRPLKKAFTSVIESLENRTLLSAGEQDAAFGNVVTNFNTQDHGGFVVRLADGKLIQGGDTIEDNPGLNNPHSSHSFALARFNPDGTPDNSFGNDFDGSNIVIVPLPNPQDYV